MGQLGIRIANVALFTLCCFQGATVFNAVSADYLRPGPAAFAAVAPPTPPTALDWSARQPILDRNVFGAQTFAGEPIPEPVEQEELEETNLPVVLLGTQVHSVRENSKAAITGRGGRDPEVVHEGDNLEKHPSARILRIDRGRVVIDNKGRREELLLAEAGNPLAAAPKPDRSSRRRSRRTATSAPERESVTDRLRDLRKTQTGGSDIATIFNQGRLTPKYDGGKLSGMEIQDIEPGSLYEGIGLKDGDVIASVNGITLDNPSAASKVLPELASGGPVEIELSDGTTHSVSPEQIASFGLGGEDEDE